MEELFVRLEKVFSTNRQRSLESLSYLYEDGDLLLKHLESVTKDKLTDERMRGKVVLLKPNWVKHNRTEKDEVCLRTHDKFTTSVLELVLKKSPAKVIIGDAPIQGCKWDLTVRPELVKVVESLSKEYSIPVILKDFRRVVFDPTDNKVDIEKNPLSEYVIFDLGKNSFLEPITHPTKNLFRVSQYDPDKFTTTHKPGLHKYCITKELFEADVVISLPKVKTHQKAGITAALKNIVGLNGDKDFLPHHRIGGVGHGGDSYSGKNYLRYLSELSLDNANRNKGKSSYWFWLKLSSLFWKISLPGKHHQLSAAWYGNDTTWRMVMDLNQIMLFGNKDGSLGKTPVRSVFSLSDGIVGGQGDGPLRPDPLALGFIGFTNHSAAHDLCMALLMGMDTLKIPLIREAINFQPIDDVQITMNSKIITLDELAEHSTHASMPPGWTGYDE